MMDSAVREQERTDAQLLGGGTLDWGAIWGGSLASIGLWILLTLFGLAVGLSAIHPREPNLKGVAIWLGIWTLIVPILALLPGVLLTGRAAKVGRPSVGMMHGMVVWGMTTFVAALLFLLTTMASLGTAITATTNTLSAAGQAVSTAVSEVPGSKLASGVGRFVGLDRDAVVAAINQRLPSGQHVTMAQLQASLQDAVDTAFQHGQMDQGIIIAALARHTSLSQPDAQRVADQLQKEWDQTAGGVMNQLRTSADTAVRITLSAVREIGANLWWLFCSMLLGLGTALGAGYMAARDTQHKRSREQPVLVRGAESPFPAGA
jgi:hypothetical protein